MSEPEGRCHLLLKGGTLIDGSGCPRIESDIAIENDRIAAVGQLDGWRADEVIDTKDLIVAPGFIDVHTHDDAAVFDDPSMSAKTSQGVTSVVAGNCGISLAPLVQDAPLPPPFSLLGQREAFAFPSVASYREAFAARPAALNIGLLTGHGNLRVETLGETFDRPATQDEVETMGRRLSEALGQGSLGLSTGLDYPNCAAAPTEELVALARSMAPFDHALFCCHMRDEHEGVLDAVEETLSIGRDGAVPVVISHHKCAGRPNFGRSRETLQAIERAAKGQSVNLDVYPYTASSTVLLPRYLRDDVEVIVAHSEPHPETAGKPLQEVAAEWGCDQIEAAERLAPAGAIYFQMDEADVERIMAYPRTMIGSDGLPGTKHPHPRLWGTFPRVLGRYVRDRGVLSLEDAVHRMTGLAADTFHLQGRGRIEVGTFADIVIFDANQIADRATYQEPQQPADGIALVLVAGTPVWRNDASTGQRPGRFLTH